ncbi:Uncharacterized protein BM_BM7381 [Brugia malayi]|uniref:Potassium channel domain-containing protein n=1 Tax=Brugia malayi TaxID=6279 RepID=A0A4E9EW12_BRUMA|nr:Uncharacterized protein BM_BM7381 [Brugia malayi]VIO87600.1 Uncharacterized protein BM_BM7381 [Brugia malayi]
MSVLLTSNCNLASSSFACNNPNVDSRSAITSSRSEAVLRSYSVSSRQSCDDRKQQNSNMPSMSVIRETSTSSSNKIINNANKTITPISNICLKRIKQWYKFLHLDYLFSLAFMMFYMFLGALLFLWLEGASDQARKLNEYKFYIHQRELFLEQLDEIYSIKTSQQRKHLLKEAIDYLHQQIGVSFNNQSEWSLTTALYYSGTVLTTIGYGDIACNTSIGRFMTIIYAIIGIPLMLITLRDLGNFLYKAIVNAIQLMHFTSNLCRIFGRINYKTSIQQNNNNDLVQLESGISVGNDNNDDDTNDNFSPEPKFQLGGEFIDESIKEDDAKNVDDMELNDMAPPRIPVSLAVGITFSWIFLCAGLFKIWEHDWTYAESCYFMFISLSTIGLGDLSVRRRDLMIMCFIFVIIGLAMVSMCINVIQRALEDFYIRVFLKLFLEYQSKLKLGNDSVGASVGMMQMWGNNKKAKYLISFLSKNRRASVLTKVQKDAVARGIEIPPIFSDIDEESGMPKMFSKDLNEITLTATVEEVIQQQVEAKQFLPIQSLTELSLPKTVFYDTGVQTSLLSFNDKGEQTLMVTLLDTAIVTDPLINEMVEEAVQCLNPTLIHSIIQTEIIELKDSECITVMPEYMVRDVQTDEVRLIEQDIQTHLYDILEAITQTDNDDFIQKPLVEMIESEMQTDPIILKQGKSRPGVSRIKEELLQETLPQRRSSASHSLSGYIDVSEDEEVADEDEDANNLDWNPIDGMHAERQRPVRDLKQFFETSKKRGSIRRRSQLRLSASPSPSTPYKF